MSLFNLGRRMSKNSIMHRIIRQQIDFGLKVLIPYVSRFPRETYNTLAQHPLCHEKDSGELRFRNGAVVTFKKIEDLTTPSHIEVRATPGALISVKEMTDAEWEELSDIPEFVRAKVKRRNPIDWLLGRFHGEA